MAKTKETPAPKKSTGTPEKSTGKGKEAPAPAKSGGKEKETPKSKDKGKDKEKSKTKVNPFKEGDVLVFDGYSQKVDDPAFKKGDYIRVLEVKSPEKFTAERIQLEEGEDEAAADTCFISEVHAPTDEEQEEIDSILEDSDEDADSPYNGDDAEEEDEDSEAGDADEDDDDDDDSEDDEDSDEDDSEESEDSDDSDDADDEDSDDEEEEEAPKKSKSKKSEPAPAPAKSKDKGKDKEAPAKSKKKSAEAEEEAEDSDEEEDAIELTDSAKAIIEDSGGDALEAVKAVKGRMNKDVVDMGVLLSHIHANNIHASILTGTGKNAKPAFAADKKGFTEYVKKELDLEPRVAYGYMAVARLASEFGIDSETVAKIGWTKLQQICDIANEGNIKALLKQAAKLNREDLVNHIRETYTDKGEGSGKRKSSQDKTKKLKLTVEVFGDQAELVKEAITTAKGETGDEDDGKALVHIIQEWAAMKNGGEDDEDDSEEAEAEDDSDSEEEEEEEKPKKKKKSKK